jgi:hypothetical protein
MLRRVNLLTVVVLCKNVDPSGFMYRTVLQAVKDPNFKLPPGHPPLSAYAPYTWDKRSPLERFRDENPVQSVTDSRFGFTMKVRIRRPEIAKDGWVVHAGDAVNITGPELDRTGFYAEYVGVNANSIRWIQFHSDSAVLVRVKDNVVSTEYTNVGKTIQYINGSRQPDSTKISGSQERSFFLEIRKGQKNPYFYLGGFGKDVSWMHDRPKLADMLKVLTPNFVAQDVGLGGMALAEIGIGVMAGLPAVIPAAHYRNVGFFFGSWFTAYAVNIDQGNTVVARVDWQDVVGTYAPGGQKVIASAETKYDQVSLVREKEFFDSFPFDGKHHIKVSAVWRGPVSQKTFDMHNQCLKSWPGLDKDYTMKALRFQYYCS